MQPSQNVVTFLQTATAAFTASTLSSCSLLISLHAMHLQASAVHQVQGSLQEACLEWASSWSALSRWVLACSSSKPACALEAALADCSNAEVAACAIRELRTATCQAAALPPIALLPPRLFLFCQVRQAVLQLGDCGSLLSRIQLVLAAQLLQLPHSLLQVASLWFLEQPN